jgi:hypothetical protein
MVINVSTKRTLNTNASEALRDAQRKRMLDAMDRGFAEGQDRVPVSGGSLLQSGYEPTWDGDTLHFGWRADHAEPQEFGSRPHWAPIKPLLKWSRRVLGDESAAYAVQKKIAEQGTEAQPFARPGRDAAKRYYGGHPLSEYLSRRI